jgi:hypothetical protein
MALIAIRRSMSPVRFSSHACAYIIWGSYDRPSAVSNAWTECHRGHRYRSKTLQILKSTQVVNVHSMLSSISCDLFIVDQVVDCDTLLTTAQPIKLVANQSAPEAPRLLLAAFVSPHHNIYKSPRPPSF